MGARHIGNDEQIPADEPDLTTWQFGQQAGSDADRLAHYSVWEGDANHRAYCGVCRDLDRTH